MAAQTFFRRKTPCLFGRQPAIVRTALPKTIRVKAVAYPGGEGSTLVQMFLKKFYNPPPKKIGHATALTNKMFVRVRVRVLAEHGNAQVAEQSNIHGKR